VSGAHWRGAFSREARNAVGVISGAGARILVLAAALICVSGVAALAVL